MAFWQLQRQQQLPLLQCLVVCLLAINGCNMLSGSSNASTRKTSHVKDAVVAEDLESAEEVDDEPEEEKEVTNAAYLSAGHH